MRKSISLSFFLAFAAILGHGFASSVAAQQKNAHKAKTSKKVIANNTAPLVALRTMVKEIRLPADCEAGQFPRAGWQATDTRVQLATEAQDIDGDKLNYRYTVTGGQVDGLGSSAMWNLAGMKPGVYRATVFVNDGTNYEECNWVMVRVVKGECDTCGKLSLSGPLDIVQAGNTATLNANISNPSNAALSYSWTVSAGRIVGGQNTPNLVVDTKGVGNQNVTATLNVGGLGAMCPGTESVGFTVANKPEAAMFDRFVFTNMDDAKARLDTFAIQLQQSPDAQAYLAVYGTCEGEGMKQAVKQRDYLAQMRGVDVNRVQIVDAGCRPSTQVELWIIPNGASAPNFSNANENCIPCRVKKQ